MSSCKRTFPNQYSFPIQWALLRSQHVYAFSWAALLIYCYVMLFYFHVINEWIYSRSHFGSFVIRAMLLQPFQRPTTLHTNHHPILKFNNPPDACFKVDAPGEGEMGKILWKIQTQNENFPVANGQKDVVVVCCCCWCCCEGEMENCVSFSFCQLISFSHFPTLQKRKRQHIINIHMKSFFFFFLRLHDGVENKLEQH